MVAVGLYWLASDGITRPYELGDWPAPFGIVLVLDRLSALMLLLTAILAVVSPSTPPRAGTGAAAISTPCSSSSSWA